MFPHKEGSKETLAWRLALSAKGRWRLSKPLPSNIAMAKESLSSIDQQSLTDYYNRVNRLQL
jgi:hypothetical protein